MTGRTSRFLVLAATALALSLGAGILPNVANAGGYDTPMLYSARHMGMGGAAVGYVGDASSMFHNPAGLGHTKRFSVMGDFSLLLGNITGSPANGIDGAPDGGITSETTVAPFFLLGGAARATDWLTFGLAVYPVASAGATYEYEQGSVPLRDNTRLLFFEVSPGLAINLPGNVNIGFGYRMTLMSLDRSVVSRTSGTGRVDFSLSGINFASFRAGIQWTPIDSWRPDEEDDGDEDSDSSNAGNPPGADRTRLGLGFTYRHRTNIDVDAADGQLIDPFTNLNTTFTLPGRLVWGLRGDIGPIGAALDVELGLNSQNDRSTISGTNEDGMVENIDNVFNWNNAVTLRLGGEYRLVDGRVALRAGYVYDAATSVKRFPTAFGTPPAPTHVATLGAGYDGGPWEVNLAYAYRRGATTVSPDDLPSDAEIMADPSQQCILCGRAGDYEIQLHGLYVDFSYDFE